MRTDNCGDGQNMGDQKKFALIELVIWLTILSLAILAGPHL